MGTPTQVVPLMAEWNFDYGIDTWAGTKKFIDATVRPDKTPQDLPQIGDSWNIGFPQVLCKNINIKYLGDKDTCGMVYICSYDSQPTDNSQNNANNNIGEDDPPQSIDISCNFETYSGDEIKDKWKWTSDSTMANNIIINKIEVNMSFNVRRKVKYDQLHSFINATKGLLGKVNADVFFGLQIGSCLYMGATADEVHSQSGKYFWITFKFQVKSIPSDDNNPPANYYGWNYIYRPLETMYDKPITFTGNKPLFASGYFALFTIMGRPTVNFAPVV